ncbi:MAG TPA: FAD-dependent oxidoreductase [Acidobacteriota bacterium]|nr:FAD-dependent oxidoreductase [Acidobacteriota bacterium]
MGREILIVGGGVVGLALAWRLRRGGASVAVVERGRCGGATSPASAGLLQAAPDLVAAAPAMLDLTLPGHRLWPEFVRELEDASGIPLGFGKRGVLAVSLDEPDDAALDAREARYRAHGLPVERLSAGAARRKEWSLGPAARSALVLKGDSWVNPVALGAALTEAFRREGGRTYERERVTALARDGDRVVGIRTRARRIPADAVVIAAGAWSAPLLEPDLPPGALTPARGQMIALGGPARDGDRPGRGAPFLQRAVTSPSVWAVPQNDGRLWVGGAKEAPELRESLDSEPRAETTARLLESLERLLPDAGSLPFHEAVVGHPCRARDRLPILGASERTRGLFFALGLHRAGILLAPETARVLAPLVLRGDQDPRLLPFGAERLRPSPAAP